MTVADADVPELERTLHFFDKLAKVTLTGTIPEQPELDDLIAAFPDIFFLWPVPVGNITVGSDAVELDPGAQKLDYEQISRLLSYFPKLEQVNLLGCTALEDLNLGLTYGDPGPILQMTWLKNLWWSGIEGTAGLPCSDAPQRLREALPNTKMKFNLETPNVDNGWRQLPNYYAMRNHLGMFYLT